MKRKNIDPNKLEETMKHYMEDEVSEGNDGTNIAGVMGKHYTVALQGDSLLLYMPDEKKRKIAEITVFALSLIHIFSLNQYVHSLLSSF